MVWVDLAVLVVRLAVGLGIAAHGAQKLFGLFGGYGLAATGGFFESIGFRPGRLFALAASASEIVGGVLIALGLFGPVGPALLIATMVVAVAYHAKNGFFSQNGGYELPLLYALAGLLLAFRGFGGVSLDDAFGIAGAFTPAVDAIVVAVGILGGLGNLALRRVPPVTEAPGTV
jgi:putative oxidoreductase